MRKLPEKTNQHYVISIDANKSKIDKIALSLGGYCFWHEPLVHKRSIVFIRRVD
jgi:hypothetical protein